MKEPRFTLKVHLPVDETYEKLAELLKRESYKKIYWHSFIPPHKFEYIFEHFTENKLRVTKSFSEKSIKAVNTEIVAVLKSKRKANETVSQTTRGHPGPRR
jgi:hypothetical protein